MTLTTKQRRYLIILLLVAVGLRLLFALAQDHLAVYRGLGGDSGWYLANGQGLFTGQPHGTTAQGVNFYVSQIPTAPLYLVFVGFWQQIFAPEMAVIVIRALQSLMGVATCWFAYRIGGRITSDARIGLLAATALALHPAFIMEAGNTATESLYIFCLTLGLWLVVDFIAVQSDNSRLTVTQALILSAIAFGLATLTRAVLLLFPLGLVIYFLLLGGRREWRLWAKRGLLLVVVYSAVISTWTIYNLTQWNRFVIASDQFLPAVWRGAVAEDGSPQQNDAILIQPDELDPDCEIDCGYQIPDERYTEQISATISGDLSGFIGRRVSELANAYLQPHGTVPLGGDPLRDMLVTWARDDRTVTGLFTVTQGEGFWPKLAIYLFHYVGIIFGLIGLWLARQQWRITLPLVGFLAYTTLIHVVLIVEPRYIFPTEVFFWIFASVALVALWDRVRARRESPAVAYQPTTVHDA